MLRGVLGGLSAAYAVAFLVAALAHAGVAFRGLGEPVIVPAAVAETLCGAAVLAGGYGALARRPWAWNGLVYTHAAALAGVLIGILALASGAATTTPLTLLYHHVIGALLAAGLAAAFYARTRG
ncbi:hypothetical protein [Nonomuraea pusilla]|uniref:Uncharacterized protein n=1 Tax=Nonomuraea pusilla TaxID=46177 RepID=A0A1H7ZC33_9ACTN|nr:hypothetical protein [Nonomuraea pusilla]SEM55059.1 hypothetical protein SAMN05660976_05458 [Nonomuraea pusilla]